MFIKDVNLKHGHILKTVVQPQNIENRSRNGMTATTYSANVLMVGISLNAAHANKILEWNQEKQLRPKRFIVLLPIGASEGTCRNRFFKTC